MKIIFATDVHGYFERVKYLLEMVEADIYIIAGDLIDIPFYTMDTSMHYHELQTFFHSLRRKMDRHDLYIEDFVDVLLRSGDITDDIIDKASRYKEYTDRAGRVMRQKYRLLENMISPRKRGKVYCLPGNYDMNLKFTALHIRDLHLHCYERGGLKFAGYGGADIWTPGIPEKYVVRNRAGIGAHMEENEMYRFFAANRPDVLVVHQPAHGVLDRVTTYGTSGSPSLRAYCDRHDVSMCLFGHVHDEWGVEKVQGTVYMNPSIFGEVTEISGRVAEGGFFYEIEVEKRRVENILYRKVVDNKIFDIAEYSLRGEKLKERIIGETRYHAHRRKQNYDTRVKKYSHIPEFELYNDIKDFYRSFQTKETGERLELLEEVTFLLDQKLQQDAAMDIMGSVNMGISQHGSDIDFVLYARCLRDCGEDFTRCPRHRELSGLIHDVLGEEYEFQIMDCINLNRVERAIRERDYESNALQLFVAYRAICKPINYRLIVPVEEMLNHDIEFRREVEGSIRSYLQLIIHTSQHTRSFEKYEKRLQNLGIKLPDSIRNKVQTYLQVKNGGEEETSQ
ncbi:MAG: metallophosphoesterase [Syntrophobacterales bacterium]|nr:metallophosphoesterase [Syntrophobacterales bacterium]